MSTESNNNHNADVTQLLQQWRNGDSLALERLTPLVYQQLHSLAEKLFRQESAGHTLQATALVNEAYVQLADANIAWNDRAHFFALSARLMRRILVNHAKMRNAKKRGGDQLLVTLHDEQAADPNSNEELLLLDAALDKLATEDARKAEVLQLHYFGGLNYSEIGEALAVSEVTVKRDLRFGRAWVHRQITAEG